MVETVICMLLVSGLFLAATTTVAKSQATQQRYADREIALLLAEATLNELLAAEEDDSDSDSGSGSLTLSQGGLSISLGSGGHEPLVESPPQDIHGDPIPGAERFTRTSTLEYVEVDAPDTVRNSATPLVRVTVTVTSGGQRLATLVGYRSVDWPEAADRVEPSR